MGRVKPCYPRWAAIIFLSSFGWLAATGAGAADRIPDSFNDVVKKVAPSVVNISTSRVVRDHLPDELFSDPQTRDFFERFFGPQMERPYTQRSLGSGVLVDRSGYILTNSHVVAKATEIRVGMLDGKEYPAKLIGSDAPSDLAVLKLEAEGNWPAVELGDSENIRVGDWVLAVGSPFGLEETVTAGIISAKSRTIGEGPYEDFLQTDASINPGNSGGPLVDMNGRIVGINTAIFSSSGGSLGIGFAVPSNMARRVYEELKKTGHVRRGWLGVVIQAVSQELAAEFKLDRPTGALVSSVTENGPAAKGGLKHGDIILKVDGKDIPNPYVLSRRISELPPGRNTALTIWRNGKQQQLSVKIGELPAVGSEKLKPGKPESGAKSGLSNLGLEADNLTEETAQELGVTNRKGVVITAVTPASPADDAGIVPGDIVRELNHKEIGNLDDYRKTISKLKPGDTLLMLVERRGTPIYVALKVPRERAQP